MRSDAFFGDSIAAMREMRDNQFDLIVADPNYGIGEARKAATRPIYAKQRNGSMLLVNGGRKHAPKDWDNTRPPKEVFDEMRRVSRHQIIWGGNHFADYLPPSPGWIVWD